MKTNDFQLELQKRYPVIVGKFDNQKVLENRPKRLETIEVKWGGPN